MYSVTERLLKLKKRSTKVRTGKVRRVLATNIFNVPFERPFNIIKCVKGSTRYLDPVYTVPDTYGHDIDFGQFAVIFIPTIFLRLVVIEFCCIMINLGATLVLKLFNFIS